MTELEKTVEALKLCIPPELLEKAMAKVEKLSLPSCSVWNHDTRDIDIAIEELLLDVGVPTHIKGYRFAVTGIRLLIEQPEMANGITKWLYPEIAHVHNETPSRVERAIRHAIEVAFGGADQGTLYSYFRNAVSADRAKATNAEFLTRLADVVCRKLGK